MKHKLSHQYKFLQKMVLTPQMRQSIALLGMSVKDLNEYVDSIVSNNPFLQKIADDGRRKGIPPVVADSQAYDDYADRAVAAENPRAGLLSQLKMRDLSDKVLEIAEYLIYEMDENGYIKTDLDETADELGVDPDETEEALAAIQGLEPAGIGGRDLRESLQLQLKRAGKEGSIEYRIVSGFMDEMARNDVKGIARALDLKEEAVKTAINNIKKLNPRPASTILSKGPDTVMPELIAKVEAKKVRLEVNRRWLPHLKLYNPYENELDIIKDAEARKFLKENMDAAGGLIDNLKRREDTICKITKYILEFQRDAFSEGDKPVKSLTLSDIAEALKFHPSTVSRAVSNKYIDINDRVIALRDLLSHGVRKADGEMTSKSAVKMMIASLVKGEDAKRPLTDDEIKTRLEKEGITLKRRTIAKYRNSLRILPAYLRKKA